MVLPHLLHHLAAVPKFSKGKRSYIGVVNLVLINKFGFVEIIIGTDRVNKITVHGNVLRQNNLKD